MMSYLTRIRPHGWITDDCQLPPDFFSSQAGSQPTAVASSVGSPDTLIPAPSSLGGNIASSAIAQLPTSAARGTRTFSLRPPSTVPTTLPRIDTTVESEGCPGMNGTIFTDESTGTPFQYQIQCYRQFIGPDYQGLPLSSFKECLDACDRVNAGFSATECFGTTWLPYNQGIKCYLKTYGGMATFVDNLLAVSGVLLTGVTNPLNVYPY